MILTAADADAESGIRALSMSDASPRRLGLLFFFPLHIHLSQRLHLLTETAVRSDRVAKTDEQEGYHGHAQAEKRK